MDNFIQEIEEDIRRDRQMALWNKYGRYAVAVALVTIIAVAAALFWRQYAARERLQDGLNYMAALELAGGQLDPSAAVPDAAIAALRDLAGGGSAGYAALARLQEAALLSRLGKADEAAAIYQSLANDSRADKAFRDLALVLLALRQIDAAEPNDLAARLAPLTAAGNPWRYSALEMTGLLAARAGDIAKAKDAYTTLADDPGTPRQMRVRAAEMLAVFGG
ncbi:MAG: tetratricopeptide repeat protein [Alphaproteobacteria bacterium]